MPAADHLELAALRVPIDSLEPYFRNPRRGDVPEIVRSLRRLGQYRPIVVNRGSKTGRENEVLAGNHTLEAARALGWSDIAATFVDVDEDTAGRIVAVDNRSNDLAAYDSEVLGELLAELTDLEGTGYSAQDLTELLASANQTPGKTTEPGAKPKRPKTKRGDLYILGEHRLVCGEADDQVVMARLMGADRADLIYTAPQLEADIALSATLELAAGHLKPGAAHYLWCNWRTYPTLLEQLAIVDLDLAACIVWRKGRPGAGSQHYRPEHEFCLYCAPDRDGDHELCAYCKGDEWTAGRGQTDVWEAPRDSTGDRPVVLAERAIENSTRGGDIVLDLFAGIGTTMLACENIKRRARLIESDPITVDVAVDRWERHAGQKAKRVR